ncbi:MAG: peptidoglycan DD-metalloendopeptidase family protein [Proteobacteria bacterium]|nr:peptidoglycan DD-metalloendopeptidase family protein [Pseudomonadota bacterium]
MFRERELLIRSDGEVRFLRVSARMQMAVVAGLVGGAIWATTAVPVTITQFLTISTNESQIFEAKLAYADLLDEVTEYQNTVDGVTSALSDSRQQLEAQLAETREMERQLAGAGETLAGPRAAVANSREVLQGHLDQVNGSLASIANDGEELESMLAKIRSDLAGSDDGRQLVERARARLKERAEGLETRLASVVDKNLKVEERNAALSTSVQVTTAERDGLVKQRDNLRGNINTLEADVAALAEERRMLEENRDELTASLAAVRSENDNLSYERLSLQEQVAALDSELIVTRSKQDEVKADLQGAAQSLQAVTGDSTVLGDTPHALRLQIDGLLADLTNQQAMEDAVLQRATDRAAGSVQEIEKIVAMSGLNIDKLLRRVESDGIGQGGPFIAASTDLPGDEELGETMLSLDNNMTRWESLKEVLRALPLSLPVDYYRLTSKYGGRVDPVNKKRSKHNGIDMAGAMNTSVYAPGPGVIVYSGKKGRYGNVVEIDHGFGVVTRFAHLNKTLVEVGDVVGHRQRVALLGNSGRSTGPHLHYEVRFDGRPMDPMKFIKAGRYVFKN